MMKVLICTLFLGWVVPGLCLECYTCVDQDGNKDKCIKTTIQCEEYENTCYSSIKWGIPPYWRPHGERIHFINKGCARAEECKQMSREVRHQCRRDWYLDWECIECCRGDMCNFYVTLGSSRQQISMVAFFTSIVFAIYQFTY